MPEGVALARDLVGPAMEAAIARLTPDVRIVAAYHLGFADAAHVRGEPGDRGFHRGADQVPGQGHALRHYSSH